MAMERHSTRHHTYLLQFGLPILFVAPEVIDLGIMFLRWDYLLFLYVFLILILSPDQTKWHKILIWKNRTTALVIIYFIVSFLMALRLTGGVDGIAEYKYASWSIKTIVWAIGAWLSFRLLRSDEKTVYKFLTVLASLIVAMQVLELMSPAFRDWSFAYYPVSAEERLLQLDFRARGPFNGFDTASLFFVVAGIYFNEFSREFPVNRLGAVLRLLLTVAGAFMSARVGFLLLILYLVVSSFARSRLHVKLVWIVAGLFAALFLLGWAGTISGQDDSLMGRNLEVIQAFLRGDFMSIQSVYGTFHMNTTLLTEGFNVFWGQGLSVDTTADQLYFKYLYMFGQIGLTIWILIHLSTFFLYYANLAVTPSQKVFRNTAIAIVIMVAIAHLKGGNYFFASRLGEIIALFLLLATLGTRRYQAGDNNDR